MVKVHLVCIVCLVYFGFCFCGYVEYFLFYSLVLIISCAPEHKCAAVNHALIGTEVSFVVLIKPIKEAQVECTLFCQ